MALSPLATRRSSAPVAPTAAWVEWLFGACVLVLLGWGSWQIWWFYAHEILPTARPVPAAPLPRVVRADDPEAVKRLQRSTDLLGEATTYVASNRRDWARAAAAQALALDPENPETQALMRRLEQEPDPTPTAAEMETRQRELRVMELLGAANTFLDAGQPAAARPLVEEASTLAPNAPAVEPVRSRIAAAP